MPGPVNPQLQEQADAMFTEVLGLQADGATVAGSFIDYQNRDIGVEVDVPVSSFLGQEVGRVTLGFVFPQQNFYTGPHNLSEPAVVAVGIPNGRNFGQRNQPVGAFEVSTGKITANLAASAGQAEGKILVSRDKKQVAALTELVKRLIEASNAQTHLR